MLAANKCDVAILNGGTMRSDQIHKQGDFKIRDLLAILPMDSQLCILEVTGRELY